MKIVIINEIIVKIKPTMKITLLELNFSIIALLIHNASTVGIAPTAEFNPMYEWISGA